MSWLGHVTRLPPTRPAQQALWWTPAGQRRRGRPRMNWRQTVDRYLQLVNKTWSNVRMLANNRSGWNALTATKSTLVSQTTYVQKALGVGNPCRHLCIPNFKIHVLIDKRNDFDQLYTFWDIRPRYLWHHPVITITITIYFHIHISVVLSTWSTPISSTLLYPNWSTPCELRVEMPRLVASLIPTGLPHVN